MTSSPPWMVLYPWSLYGGLFINLWMFSFCIFWLHFRCGKLEGCNLKPQSRQVIFILNLRLTTPVGWLKSLLPNALRRFVVSWCYFHLYSLLLRSFAIRPRHISSSCLLSFYRYYLRIEYLILSVYWSINVRWRVTNYVNLRNVVYA